jgi:adenylate cyclase class IV
MIEVEKKFLLDGSQTARLIDGAEYAGERVFTDTYYDTKDYNLTKKDIWLRSREGRFELKVPVGLKREKRMDQYEEFESDTDIKNILHIDSEKDLNVSLSENGLKPFCVCRTTRKKYKKIPFIIDLDHVEFDRFEYSIGEVEFMVEEKDQMDEAIQRILAFAKQYQLTIAPVRGKVIEFLKRYNKKHYQALIDARIIES